MNCASQWELVLFGFILGAVLASVAMAILTVSANRRKWHE